jgi:large conductance mechanosensitive channel
MSIVSEFRSFIMRGNVVDLAVGVIIGGAFGKIVSSLVADVIMPPIGLLLGGVDFRDLKITIQEAIPAANGTAATTEVALNIGIFMQTIIDFLIIGGAVFAVIRGVTALQRMATRDQQDPATPAPQPAAPTPSEQLLTEIRDLLRQQRG